MKKTLLLLLSVGLLAGVAVACAGSDIAGDDGAVGIVPLPDVIDENETPDETIVDDGSDITFDDNDIVLPGEGGDNFDEGNFPEYLSITGEITSIEDVDGTTYITIEDADGNPAILMINEATVFPFSNAFEIGDVVTGWYLSNAPMIMIWPPHYSTKILAVGTPEGVNIRADRFHLWEDGPEAGFMISKDGMFAFKTDDNTEIILADGQDFCDGDFDNRRIVVIYGISTRSIPEMATADKLIVLFEDIMPIT